MNNQKQSFSSFAGSCGLQVPGVIEGQIVEWIRRAVDETGKEGGFPGELAEPTSFVLGEM